MSSIANNAHQWLQFVPHVLKASPLYGQIWEHLKDDPEMLEIVALSNADQPMPITFFTAVNYLLMAEPQQPLALFYPHLHPEDTRSPSEAYPFFREFVLAQREELGRLLPTARLQTNEVTRCCNLLPAFFLAYQRGGGLPLHMIELGSSVGFNLNWFHYGYHYGETLVGDMASPIQIDCDLQGTLRPPLPEVFPPVASCQGIELWPRDIQNEADMRWVYAAIWPEEVSRYQMLDSAIKFARQTPFLVHGGDACEHLPKLLAALPEAQPTVIWHSYALTQGPLQVMKQIEQQIIEASREHTIYRISLEFVGQGTTPRLDLYEYQCGSVVKQDLLAYCAVHGEHMTWLLDTHE